MRHALVIPRRAKDGRCLLRPRLFLRIYKEYDLLAFRHGFAKAAIVFSG